MTFAVFFLVAKVATLAESRGDDFRLLLALLQVRAHALPLGVLSRHITDLGLSWSNMIFFRDFFMCHFGFGRKKDRLSELHEGSK